MKSVTGRPKELMDNAVITIRLEKNQKQKLIRRASKDKLSPSAWVRDAIDKKLEHSP